MVDLEFAVKRMHKLEGDGKLKAFVDVAITDQFLIKGLRVVDGKNGLFVGMPREQGRNGQWYQTVAVLSEEIRGRLSEIVLQTYQAE